MRNCFWRSGWQNRERDKGEKNQETSSLISPDMPQWYNIYNITVQYDMTFLVRFLTQWILDWKWKFLKWRSGEAMRKVSGIVVILVGIYLPNIIGRNTKTRCGIFLKLTIQILEWRQWRCSGVFIVEFRQIHILLYCFYC